MAGLVEKNIIVSDVGDSAEPLRSRRKAIPALTGMRAVACLLVVLSHLRLPGSTGLILEFERNGFVGVTFFFILSGFVLAYNHEDAFGGMRAKAIWSYAVSRFARVYPTYALAIVAVWWIGGAAGPLWLYLAALQSWSPDVYVAYGIVGPSWSIGVEVFLYAAFPLLAILLGRLTARRSPAYLLTASVIVAVLMLLAAGIFVATGASALPITNPASAHRWLYRMPSSRLGDFLLGMIAALMVSQYEHVVRRWATSIRTAGYVASTVILGMLLHRPTPAFAWDVAFAIPFVIVITWMATEESGQAARFLGSKAMVFAGEVSFAFYLVHVPAAQYWQKLHAGHEWVDYCAQFIFISLIAVGFHFMIEKPLQKLIKGLFVGPMSRFDSALNRIHQWFGKTI